MFALILETHSLVRILCVANQQGGVGKTATAVNLSTGLAKAGKRTVLLDLDPRCDATLAVGGTAVPRQNLLHGNRALVNDIQHIAELELLPGSPRLADVQQFASVPPQNFLEHAHSFRQIVADHDFVVIDCPSTLTGVTEWAMIAADELVLPLACEFFALEGVPAFVDLVRRVMRASDQALDFAGVLITKYNESWQLAEEIENQVRDFFGEIVFQTVIPFDQAIAAAKQQCHSVIDQTPRSRSARAYIELCKEVIQQ